MDPGEVGSSRANAIDDVGRVINPLAARSQIEGGIIQAMGHTFRRCGSTTRDPAPS